MAFKVIVKPAVWLDVQEAIDWYEKESIGLGNRFVKSFEEAKDKLIKQPATFRNITPNVKRVILKNFPYKIFYHFSDHIIVIIALMHSKRSNTFIKRRFRDFK